MLVHKLRECLKGRCRIKSKLIWSLSQIDVRLRFKCGDTIREIPAGDIVNIKRIGNLPPFESFKIYLKDGNTLKCSFESVSSYLKESIASYKKGDLDAAITSAKKAYFADPMNPNSSYNLACFYSLKGNIDEGVKWLEKAYALIMNDHKYSRLIKTAKKDKGLEILRKQAEYKEKCPGFAK